MSFTKNQGKSHKIWSNSKKEPKVAQYDKIVIAKMNTIIFIRHSTTILNQKHLIQGRGDYPLSDEGLKFAKNMAKKYHALGLTFDLIYSSPLIRAYKTAQVFKDEFKNDNDIIKDDALIERDFGSAEGDVITEDVYYNILNDLYEGIEPSKVFVKRVKDGIDRIMKLYENKTILIVTHSHTIKGFLYNLDKSVLVSSAMRNVSYTKVEYDSGNYRIVNMNMYPEDLENE